MSHWIDLPWKCFAYLQDKYGRASLQGNRLKKYGNDWMKEVGQGQRGSHLSNLQIWEPWSGREGEGN